VAQFPDKLTVGKTFSIQNDMEKLYNALLEAETIMINITTKSSKVNRIKQNGLF
jgi:hypothetical protein